MDHIKQFIVDAAALGIRLYLDQQALKTRAPAGAITEEIGRFIRANKHDIVECLASGFDVPAPLPATARRLVPRATTEAAGPLSLAQERFWFINQLSGDSALYNMPIALRISGIFDVDIAERALQRIVDRHAPLHSIYRNGADGTGVQERRASREFRLARIDLASCPVPEQEEKVAAAMHDSAGRPFDLGQDLMLRGTYLTLSPSEGILLLCVHHIAADGWSFRVMELEFVEQYHALREGRPDPLPPLRITYADYVDWQRARLEEKSADAELEYWERQLAGLPAVHALVLDRARSGSRGHQGGQHGFQLDTALYARLRQLALATNTTLFMILHAAFSLLLSRYSNRDDIVVGTPVLNRLDKELELLVGCFVNSLVLRVQCSPDLTLPEFLRHVKAVNLDAQTHQEITFEQIVDHLNPPRSALYSPLFQIMFSMGMPQETAHRKMPDLELAQLQHVGTTAKFDLSLYAQESLGELFFGVEYNTDLFDTATIECMAGHYQVLLDAIATTPAAPLARLSMLTPVQSRCMLETCGGATGDIGPDCAHEPFERQAELNPDAIAIVHAGLQWTYAELNVRANRLARHLRSLGVGPDVRVGVYLERSLDLALAILAVWKAGGAFVPLDPLYPPARLAGMLDDAGVGCLLSHGTLAPNISTGVPTLLLDEAALQQALALQPADNLERSSLGLEPTHLAYVIFTSGSTGRPKGVMVEHRSVINLGQAMQPQLQAVAVRGPCRWAWNASPAFDASLQALLQWGNGSTLHLLPDDVRRDPQELWSYLREHRIDVLDATPLQVQMLLECGGAQDALPSLVVGGEAIGPVLWQRIAGHYAGREQGALNAYGPTEATVNATVAVIGGDRPTIGRPLRNVRCYVLDRHGQLQPEGVPGELAIGGAGLARGYANRPDLTTGRFVELDLGGLRERVYRTGDIVRWRSTGELEFIGRADGQVKIRGYRVELGEIEFQLRQAPGVGAAAVTARGEEGEAPRELVAYIVPTTGAVGGATRPDWAEALKQSLRAALPEYMVPAHFVSLQALPLTPGGKLDSAALPLPEAAGTPRPRQLATRPAEKLVARFWIEQLGVGTVGLDDNFFELGGHSILAARVVSRLASVFQVKVPLRMFFERPTVRDVVGLLGQLGDPATVDEIAQIYQEISNLDADEMEAMLVAQEGA